MNNNIKLLFLFIFFLLLQVLILNNINLFGYINPYLYISLVFIFPIKKSKISILTLAFLIGLSVDVFTDSVGINAIATTSIAYIRLNLFKKIFQKPESDYQVFSLKREPIGDIFNYVAILTVTHHFILFTLLNFSFNNFLKNVILNTIISSIFTLTLYFLGNFILRKKIKNEA